LWAAPEHWAAVDAIQAAKAAANTAAKKRN
jgi:hypothetical protein